MDETEFNRLVSDAIDNIPEQYAKHIHNVAFIVEDVPSPEQRVQLSLRSNQSLFGLYQGVPLDRRGGNPSGFLPDKITVFKDVILSASTDLPSARAIVNETIWHEVAHYFGLNHAQIHQRSKQHQ